MGMTFAEKALANKSGQSSVSPGDLVEVEPDRVLSHDNTAAISEKFYSIGIEQVRYPDRLCITLDHCAPAATEKHALNHKTVREFVKKQGVKNFFEVARGICHQVFPEEGLIFPGGIIVGSDSHTCHAGAFGMFATGIGRSEVASVWATGSLWLRVPESYRINVEGKFPEGVYAKDFILKINGDLGADGAIYKSVEFHGSTIRNMTMDSKAVIPNMTYEIGAKNGYIPPDDIVLDYLKDRVKHEFDPVYPDDDAVYEKVFHYDVSDLEPQVSCPHNPDNVKPISDVEGTAVDEVFIGTCTNGRYEDYEVAAKIIKGQKKNPGTRFIIVPASMLVYQQCLRNGLMEIFADFGAAIMAPGCGPCLGNHEGVPAPGEVVFAAQNRNFKGRMGSRESEVYLGSPAACAATAIEGKITDPRKYLN